LGGFGMFAAYGRYWDFQGRAGRSEYWLFGLFNLLVGLAAGLVDTVVFRPQGWSVGPCGLFFTFANLIPNLSVGFRRLHDIDRSAWWLLMSVIPVLGWLALFVFSVMPGTPGANRFGSPGGRAGFETLQETFA
jgi:uncharacterized membrane protein YhaH (DUF805 family)